MLEYEGKSYDLINGQGDGSCEGCSFYNCSSCTLGVTGSNGKALCTPDEEYNKIFVIKPEAKPEVKADTDHVQDGKVYELVSSRSTSASGYSCDGCSFYNDHCNIAYTGDEPPCTARGNKSDIFVLKKDTNEINSSRSFPDSAVGATTTSFSVAVPPIEATFGSEIPTKLINDYSEWVDYQLQPKKPEVTTPHTQGSKNDSNKLRFDLVPARALQQVVQVVTYGETKYPSIESEDGKLVQNWKLLSNAEQRLYAAVQRHLWAWQAGEVHDSETGINHLAHACSSLLFMLDLANGANEDN